MPDDKWYDPNLDRSETKRTWFVFLDSLSPDDVAKMDFVKNQMHHARLDAECPRVTPSVLSQVWTGVDPANNGLPSVSRFQTESRARPAQYTLPEMAAEDHTYDRVLNFHLPFCTVGELKADADEDFWTASQAMNQLHMAPAEAQAHLQVPGPAGDARRDDPEVVFNLMIDYTQNLFGQARQLAESQAFDLTFVSHRLLDTLTHWRRTLEHPAAGHEGMPDGIRYYRDAMLLELDRQLYELSKYGRVFLFGDHGSEPLDQTFRINRWLWRNGYLDADIDHEWIEQSEEYGVLGGEEHPVDEAIANQLSWDQPGVTIKNEETTAICADPFSTGITIRNDVGEDAVDELIDDLMATGYFRDVHRTDDLWDADGLYRDECPDLYPDRKPGVFVSGNLHAYPVGVGYMRSGVHGQYGAIASTEPLSCEGETVTPLELHYIIRNEYLGLADWTPLGGDLEEMTPDERAQVIEYAHQLGATEEVEP